MERRALVTGGSGGIGAAAAVQLAESGADVWITYSRDRAGAERTLAAIHAAGVRGHASRLELGDPGSVTELAAEIAASWASLHVLVSNAGVCPYTAWDRISAEEWDTVMAVNARGTFLLVKEMVPLLRAASGDRSIVALASVAGEIGGLTTSVHYAASKGAVLATVRTFARLLAPEGIRCNCVSPGLVDTPMTGQLDAGKRAALASAIPLGRPGRPEEVASTICLLASPAASFTTGATYDVNGGVHMA